MAGDLLKQAQAAMKRGDFFTAHDLARAGVEGGLDDEGFKYLQVLALARMGDLAQARERYDSFGLSTSQNVDVAALGARLLKDAAFATRIPDPIILLQAAEAYRAIYERTGDTFPGVNAATLFLLSGAANTAGAIASEVLTKLPLPRTYYDYVSRAEAYLDLGRIGEACREIAAACRTSDADIVSRATTRRQFSLLADYLGLAGAIRDSVLAPLRPPKVFMFCGHMMPAPNASAEAKLANRVAAIFEEENARVGYGALASGADIVIAEELLKSGGELNVVLPFEQAAFLEQSVHPAGDGWDARFSECLSQARTVTMATDMPFMNDATQFAYGSLICMGMARLRADHLRADVLQLAVWDGVTAHDDDPAGTAVDVANWERANGRTRILSPTWTRKSVGGSKQSAPDPSWVAAGEEVTRESRALIFTDFRGFSKLPESMLPLFWSQVMGRMLRVVENHSGDVCYRNTWGDALYAVVSSATAAAAIALELQDMLTEVDYPAMGLSAEPHMRVGAHYGPVFRWREASGAMNYYGTQVSRAARIEPITPPGAVYVTEQFAAMLAMESQERFVCRYVGQIALAKGFGTARMYLLKRKS
jgi:adenylate cyclase